MWGGFKVIGGGIVGGVAGFLVAGPAGAVMGAGMGAQMGLSVHQYQEAKEDGKRAKAEATALNTKRKVQTEVLAKNQFDSVTSQYAAASVYARKEISDEKRKAEADYKNYGNPVG